MLKKAGPKMKKCRICRCKFIPYRTTDPVCQSIECRVAYGTKAAEKSRANREKEAKRKAVAEKKADREKLVSMRKIGEWHKELQPIFNRYIRLRDMLAGHSCISSGRPLDWVSKNKVDAGHYRSVGSAPHLRYNEDNVHAQSKSDNRFLGGCAVDYRIRLIARIGIERVEALEADQAARHYTIDDLKALIATYKQKIKELNSK